MGILCCNKYYTSYVKKWARQLLCIASWRHVIADMYPRAILKVAVIWLAGHAVANFEFGSADVWLVNGRDRLNEISLT